MRDMRAHGSVGIILALTIVTLLVMAALVVDIGSAILARQDLQVNVDAAALAGAQSLRDGPSAAKAKAAEYYSRNLPNNPSPTVASCPPGSDPNSTCYQIGTDFVEVITPAPPSAGGPADARRIRVTAWRTVPYYFARVIGFTNKRLSARAAARGGGGGAGGMVLDPSSRGALTVGVGTSLRVTGGGLVVNSNHAEAVVVENYTSLVSDQPLQVVGGWRIGFRASISPTPVQIPGPLPDPLANLQPPAEAANCGSVTGAITVTAVNSPYTLPPGVHPGINVNAGGTLILEPGVHVLCNGLTSQGSLVGRGVFIYVRSGLFQIEPGYGPDWGYMPPAVGNTILTPITSGPYAGMTFFNARDNSSHVFIRTGIGRVYQGIFYNPSSETRLAPSPRCAPSCDFSQVSLITWQLRTGKDYAGAPREILLSAGPLPGGYGDTSVVLEE